MPFQGYTEPYTDKLLPDLLPQEQHVFTLVLDLNETLIHYIWTVRLQPHMHHFGDIKISNIFEWAI